MSIITAEVEAIRYPFSTFLFLLFSFESIAHPATHLATKDTREDEKKNGHRGRRRAFVIGESVIESGHVIIRLVRASMTR